jgi:hypothetical protein
VGQISVTITNTADPSVIALRIFSERFKVNRSGNYDLNIFRHIRSIVPNRSEAEYQDLLGYAKREWMEVYGF